MSSQVPTQIKLHKRSKTLEVHFGSDVFVLAAEYLRVYSPSAEVRGHGNPVLQTGKLNVAITGVEPIGQYAIKLIFDDGHDSGIYNWSYLWELGHDYESLWSQYLEQLKEAGAQRDPDVSTVRLLG